MYTWEHTYENFDGEEVTETFRFNLTTSEVAKLQLSTPGSYIGSIESKKKAKDQAGLLKAYEDIILMAYGVKSEDGRRFIKSEEVKDDFKSTQAFSDLFILLMTNEEEAFKFISGIMPLNNEQRRVFNDKVHNKEELQKLIDESNAANN